MKKHTQLSVSAIQQSLSSKSNIVINTEEAKEIKGGWITNTDLDQV